MLSPSKIALTIIVIITVIFGYRLLNQFRNRRRKVSNDRPDALDLTKCDTCQKYVDVSNHQCLRGDCPYV